MAINWTAKSPSAVLSYTWLPALADGDTVTGGSIVVSSGTAVVVSYDVDADGISAFISGGTAGAVTTFTGTANTSHGETLTETIYLPITLNNAALGYTANDICTAAMRKIVGISESPDADQAVVALEHLNDMLAQWKGRGMDVGAVLPLTLTTQLLIPDEFAPGIKDNLRIALHEFYGVALSGNLQRSAMLGFELIKQRLAPTKTVEYF